MLSSDPSLFDACTEIIVQEFGPIDYQSDILPWSNTEYYREEMGPDIARRFIFIEPLHDPSILPNSKIFTNMLENRLAVQTGTVLRRRINLDPGYITEAKVILASAKDFAHRIYIGDGIYAEVTLRYSTIHRCFTTLDHTYPDYGTEAYRTLFNKARNRLRASLNRTSRK